MATSASASNADEHVESLDPPRMNGPRSHSAFDRLLEGYQLIGFDWRYLYVNHAVLAHARKSADEMIGRTVMEVYPGVESTDLFHALRACMTERAPRRLETEFHYPDGSAAWFDLSIQPQPEGIFILSFDITERKNADEARRRIEASLREAQRIASLGSWEIVRGSGARFWSDETFRILGWEPASAPVPFDELRRACAAEDWARLYAAAEDAMARGGSYEIDARIVRRDGAKRWITVRGEAVRDSAKNVVGLRGTVQDVTDRKRADESLRAVRDELAAIVQASPIPILALDIHGDVVLWGAAAARLFGWSTAEVVGRPLPIVPEDKRDEYESILRGVSEGQTVRNLVTTRVARDGRRIPVSLSNALLRGSEGETKGMVSVLIDLTEQTVLREELIESEHRFAAAFDASPMAKVLIRIADRRVVEANRAYLRLSGVERDEVIDKPTTSLPIAPSGERREEFWALVHERRPIEDFEFAYRTARGVQGEAIASAERISIKGEDFLLVAVQDITARRRADRALQESDARFRQLADTIQEVFWLTDLDKQAVIYVSPGYEHIWGRPSATLASNPRDWLDAIHPDDRERVMKAALTKQVAGTYDEEYRIVRPDGAVRWIRDRGFPVRDASGKVHRVAGSAQDVTERRELEAQLRQTQKMESIGLLAGGVAHDFNNLLTVISSNCEALGESIPRNSESEDLLRELRDATDRATTLTRQLLSFSRREVIEPRVVDLANVVIDTEKLLRRILGEDVILTLSLAPGPSRVNVDPGSWVQVLMNLAVNARDAMPRGGKLTIGTGSVILGDEIVRAHPHVKPGRHVLLTVSDTGAGMPTEVAARIFEPFFTTKEVGRGTGLGLSVVHGIVTQSGGHITVKSELGVGTTFRICIPAVTCTLSKGSGAPPGVDVGGGETVLVVEDEPSIRRIAVRALEKLGYALLSAGDGEEGLAVAREHAGPIHLLVTDVVMPRMDGHALAETLRAAHPEMRVLYTSGYTDDAVLRYGIQQAEVAFLSKPYDASTLRQKVREVLDFVAG